MSFEIEEILKFHLCRITYLSIYGQTIMSEMSNCTPIKGKIILHPITIWLDYIEMTLLI